MSLPMVRIPFFLLNSGLCLYLEEALGRFKRSQGLLCRRCRFWFLIDMWQLVCFWVRLFKQHLLPIDAQRRYLTLIDGCSVSQKGSVSLHLTFSLGIQELSVPKMLRFWNRRNASCAFFPRPQNRCEFSVIFFGDFFGDFSAISAANLANQVAISHFAIWKRSDFLQLRFLVDAKFRRVVICRWTN